MDLSEENSRGAAAAATWIYQRRRDAALCGRDADISEETSRRYSNNVMTPQNDMGDLEPLLLQYKVDIAHWGHIHFAQLSCPMYQAACVTTKDAAGYDAPIHAVVGNAGQSLTAIDYDPAPWSLYNLAHWGFAHLTIHNSTHLTFDFHNDAPRATAPPINHTFSVVRAFPRV